MLEHWSINQLTVFLFYFQVSILSISSPHRPQIVSSQTRSNHPCARHRRPQKNFKLRLSFISSFLTLKLLIPSKQLADKADFRGAGSSQSFPLPACLPARGQEGSQKGGRRAMMRRHIGSSFVIDSVGWVGAITFLSTSSSYRHHRREVRCGGNFSSCGVWRDFKC